MQEEGLGPVLIGALRRPTRVFAFRDEHYGDAVDELLVGAAYFDRSGVAAQT